MPDYSRPRNLPNVAEFQWEDDEDNDNLEFFLECRKEGHIRSVDSKGHSDTLGATRVPQGTNAQIMYRVNNPQTPYRSQADFVRDAVIHWVLEVDKWMEQDGYSSMVQVILASARAESLIVRTEAKKAMVARQIESITNALAEGEWATVREAIEHGKESLALMDVNVEQLAKTIENAEREMERADRN